MAITGGLDARSTLAHPARVVALSFVPLVGFAGRISLCQLSFGGIGAVVVAHLGRDGNPIALVWAVLLTAVVGAIVALPALRLAGIYLALSTAAFAVALDRWIFNLPAFDVFGHKINIFQGGSLDFTRPKLGPVDLAGDQAFFIAGSVVFALFFHVQRQFAESLGRPWGPMGIMLADVGLNAFFNWMFVFGHLGVPALGLVGSGWATLLARFSAVTALAVWLKLSPTFAPVRDAPWTGWERGRFGSLLKLGVPAAGMLLFEGGAFVATALMMGWLGTVPLAAHQIAIGCASLAFMFPLGLSLAVSLRISRAGGEGRTAALRPIGFGALLTGLAIMLGFALAFALAGRTITAAFTPAVDVAALAAQLLVVAAFFQLFDGGQVISVGALRGLHDVRVPTVITFIAYWVIGLPLGYGLAFHTALGAVGLWTGLAAGLGSAAMLLGWRFHRLTLPART